MRRRRRVALIHYSIRPFDRTTPSHDERAVTARPNSNDGGARRRSVRRGPTPARSTVRSAPASRPGEIVRSVREGAETRPERRSVGRRRRGSERLRRSSPRKATSRAARRIGTPHSEVHRGATNRRETVDGGTRRREVDEMSFLYIKQFGRLVISRPPSPRTDSARCVARFTATLSILCMLFSSRRDGREPGTGAAVTPEWSNVY